MIIFNTKLVHASWSEKDGKWKLRLEQNGSIINDEADVVLDASGILKYVNHTNFSFELIPELPQSMEMARY